MKVLNKDYQIVDHLTSEVTIQLNMSQKDFETIVNAADFQGKTINQYVVDILLEDIKEKKRKDTTTSLSKLNCD